MKTKIERFLLVALVACSVSGCKTFETKSSGRDAKPIIIHQPETQIAEVGTLIAFAVAASPSNLVSFQWKINDVPIAGATNSFYALSSVAYLDVAAYSVAVSYGSSTIVSSNAYLSVYSLTTSNSSSGTLTCPVGVFSTSAYTCSGISFTGSYSPGDSASPYFFYGPNATGSSGPFRNLTYSPTLTLSTLNTALLTTGARLTRSFFPILPEPGCAGGTGGAVFGPYTLDPGSSAKYRATFYFKPPAPADGRVSFSWAYH